MTDRELLEFAAKAAGYDHLEGWVESWQCLTDCNGFSFDPLHDDGDALRLLAKLNLNLLYGSCEGGANVEVFAEWHCALDDVKIIEEFDGDSAKPTRRAIVRAAAEIGKSHI